MYLIFFIWGGKKCFYVVMKFIFYIVGGFLFILLVGLILVFYGDVNIFDMLAIVVKDIFVNL